MVAYLRAPYNSAVYGETQGSCYLGILGIYLSAGSIYYRHFNPSKIAKPAFVEKFCGGFDNSIYSMVGR